MKRVILTGATGFIGSNLARRLLRDGHELHLLVRPSYKSCRIEEIRDDMRLHEVDLGNEKVLTDVVGKIQADWVFHLSAHGAYSTQKNLRKIVQTNIVGTLNLVEACLKTGFEAFINTGSSSEYGFKDHAPSETEWLEPNSHYAITKAFTTLFCRHTAQSRKVHLTTLRLYSVYGPYEETSRLIPTLIRLGLQNKLPLLVNPNIGRDFVYIDDVIEAYLLAAAQPDQEPGPIYNVGTGTQTSIREVVAVAKKVLGITDEPEWGSMPDRQWDTNTWIADNRKIKNKLGWQPHSIFEQGFRLMVKWFRNNSL